MPDAELARACLEAIAGLLNSGTDFGPLADSAVDHVLSNVVDGADETASEWEGTANMIRRG